MRKHLDEGWAVDGVIRAAVERAWAPGGATRVGVASAREEGGATRLASEQNWAPGGVLDVMIQEQLEKLWAPGGACRLMVENRDSAWWAGMARRAAAVEARWAEQRKAHAASGRTGNFAKYGTDFAGVRGNDGGFLMCIQNLDDGSTLCLTYRDENVAALAYDIARGACDRAPRNYPNRGFFLAASPPPGVLEEMMRRAAGDGSAAGGGPRTRVVLRETIEQYRVRSVVTRTLARELSKIRSTEVRRELVKLRERDGVLDDDACDAIAARVDALDLERMLGDRLRAEGFAEPPGDGSAAAGKKRGRASSAYAKEQGLPAEKRSRA